MRFAADKDRTAIGVTKVARWCAVCLGVALLTGGLGRSVTTARGAAAADDAGKKTFEDNCSVCHDEDGSGNTPIGMSLMIPDLRSDDVQKHTDQELINIVTNGMDPMPSFKDKLSADEIKGVVAYIRVLGKNKK
jgi:mono/diheme cytochrome c family protein